MGIYQKEILRVNNLEIGSHWKHPQLRSKLLWKGRIDVELQFLMKLHNSDKDKPEIWEINMLGTTSCYDLLGRAKYWLSDEPGKQYFLETNLSEHHECAKTKLNKKNLRSVNRNS